MRLISRILGFTLALVVAVVLVAFYWIQDANNLKPELQALIAANSEYSARFNGDLTWSLFPPLHLQAHDVTLSSPEEEITAASIDLRMDLSAMWEDINQWQVTELHLRDTVLEQTEEGSRSTIRAADVLDFRLGEPSTFHLDASHQSTPDSEPFAAILNGSVTFRPEDDDGRMHVLFEETAIGAEGIEGICEADVKEPVSIPANLPAANDDEILPIATLREFDITANCALTALQVGSETFNDAVFELTNINGQLNFMLNVHDFLGGTLVADADVDISQTPAQWTLLPEIENVDSERLMQWTDQKLQWMAPVAFNSTIKMQGNSEAELATSLRANSEFDGGQGQINISAIKEQLMQLALLAGKAGEVSAWPDMWEYQEFTGRWNIVGPAHDLKFAIDNMSVDAEGTVDYLADSMNLLAEVTLHEAPEGSPFGINPMLQGTAIPVRCRGSTASPTCKLDDGAAQNLIARALQRDDESGLRHKLEEKIEEDVPEEYRDTARELLDLLGRALEGN